MSSQIITVNEKEIPIATIKNEKYVAIKPICSAIGVDFQKQLEKIKNDEIIGQLYTLRGITGADGKTYKMGTIPLRYVFGWLFTINPKNVKPEIKQDLINYKKECYDALFDTFTKRTAILKEKTEYQVKLSDLEEEIKELDAYKEIQKYKSLIKNASERMNKLDKNVINEQLDLFKKD